MNNLLIAFFLCLTPNSPVEQISDEIVVALQETIEAKDIESVGKFKILKDRVIYGDVKLKDGRTYGCEIDVPEGVDIDKLTEAIHKKILYWWGSELKKLQNSL